MKRLALALIFVTIWHIGVYAQPSEISGRRASVKVVYNDSLAAAVTKALTYKGRQWISVDEFQFFSVGFQFDTTGFAAGIGFTSVDTVEISMESWLDDSSPSKSSVGFLPLNTKKRTIIATFDSTTVIDFPKTFVSFHGASDPTLSPAKAVRFYSRVVNGFTSGGLKLKVTFFEQP